MIRIGPAGWSYPDWEGRVYPRAKPAGFHPLRYLADFVDTIEVNSSFYATPRSEVVARWVTLVDERPRFRFTAKLQNVFTHEPWPKSARDSERLALAWLAGVDPLVQSDRLAAVLLQFPHSFRPTKSAWKRLEELVDLLAPLGHERLVLEVRRRDWFDAEALARMERLGLSVAWIDLPPAPDHPPRGSELPVVGPLGYVRLHGRNATTWFDSRAGRDQRYDYLYGPEEMGEIAGQVRRLADAVDQTYVITNNHFGGQAVANAFELMALLGDELPLAPIELVESYPSLRSQVRPRGQASLF